jgi:hypothetical protein
VNDRVLFLDIDGVLVAERTLLGRAGRYALGDSGCVSQLNRVTNATGVDLVLSSSWRFCGLEEMRLILRYWGVAAPLVSMTPDLTKRSGETGLYSGVPRGREIQKWLDENPVAAFAIVDDDADMEHLTPWTVRTKFEDGLTSEGADRLIAILSGGMEAR